MHIKIVVTKRHDLSTLTKILTKTAKLSGLTNVHWIFCIPVTKPTPDQQPDFALPETGIPETGIPEPEKGSEVVRNNETGLIDFGQGPIL